MIETAPAPALQILSLITLLVTTMVTHPDMTIMVDTMEMLMEGGGDSGNGEEVKTLRRKFGLP